jgi:WD40 repeat protein
VVTGGYDGRVLMSDPADPGASPAELGRHASAVRAVAVLPDGRVVTGGYDRRVLVWDPAHPGASPAELGRHDDKVRAVAVLADRRVVTGGDDRRVLVWDPAKANAQAAQLSCSVTAVATAPLGPAMTNLVIAHKGSGFSLWSFTG